MWYWISKHNTHAPRVWGPQTVRPVPHARRCDYFTSLDTTEYRQSWWLSYKLSNARTLCINNTSILRRRVDLCNASRYIYILILIVSKCYIMFYYTNTHGYHICVKIYPLCAPQYIYRYAPLYLHVLNSVHYRTVFKGVGISQSRYFTRVPKL